MSERTQAVQYIELDIRYCSLTYGEAPCTAAVGVTGAAKCVNTNCPAAVGGCQDTEHYTEVTKTLRFAVPADYLSRDIDCRPIIDSIEHTPGRVSLGEDLGERPSITVKLKDGPDSDAGDGFDKYFAERDYNPSEQGTLFGKLRVRQPYLRGCDLRWYQGFVEDDLADMEVRHFKVDFTDGPNHDGIFTIVAKDVLKQLDGERAQAPPMSTGFLATDITDVATTLTLLPSGIGDDEYDPLEIRAGTRGSGFGNIGGNEIVAYGRDPYAMETDPDCVLLLHFDGSNGAGSTTDSSPAGHSVTLAGDAVLSNVHPVFGPTGLRCQGTSDFASIADHANWDLGSGDFFIEGRIWPEALDDGRVFSQASSSTVGYKLIANTDGSLTFSIDNTSNLLTLTSAAALLTADVESYTVAVERFGNLWTLFLDGAVAAQTTNALSVPAFAAAFRVGAGQGGNNGFDGWIDEFVFVKRAIAQGAAYVPLTAPYASSSDELTITRAQFNTAASEHQADDRFQWCLVYTAQTAAAIIRDLEVNYAGVPTGYINQTVWNTEISNFQGQTYSACICEPTPVDQLVGEVIEQANLMHWTDDTVPELRLQVIREVANAETFDDSKRLLGSLNVEDQPEKRITRVHVYFGLIDPTKGIDDLDNYRSVSRRRNAEVEANYGNIVIKTIKSRWIPEFGGAVADVVADTLLARFSEPPRKFTFEVMRTGSVPVLGNGYQISAWNLQDGYGAASPAQVQVTRLTAGPAKVKVEADEMLLGGAIVSDPNNHVVQISTNTNNFNLRTRHDALYGAPTPGITITCIIDDGVIVGSADTTQYAFDQGDWPGSGSEVNIVLEIYGRIQGAGGKGGKGAYAEWVRTGPSTIAVDSEPATDGLPGGPALKLRYPTTIDGDGEIWSGAGGGGGGGVDFPAPAAEGVDAGGGGGGGGQGQLPGEGGQKRGDGTNGSAGTTEAPGAKGNGGDDGKSGGLGGGEGSNGANGQNGVVKNGGAGGAAGNAIEGDAFVTEIGTVSIVGPRI